MKKNTIILIALILLSYMSSCNFLDIEDTYSDTLTYDSVFHNTRNLQKYMWSIANDFPDEGQILTSPYTPGPLATDEAITTYGDVEHRGVAFVLGKCTPDDLRGFNEVWVGMYKNIRRVNTLLNRMDEASDLTTITRNEIVGYSRFIRAYSYYHILMDFGPVIILGDKVLENNEPIEYYETHRATYDESVNYICDELEAAALLLPKSVPLGQFGRPTQGAAYGLIARLRLQQASPLYNGGDAARRYFGSWKRSVDGEYYVSQTYDEKKWAVAAAAAKRIIDMNRYSLHTVEKKPDTPLLPANVPTAAFPDGAGEIDPFRSYADMFNGESVPQQNPEYVWGRMSGLVKYNTRQSFPVTMLNGWNGMCVTQKVVDAYRTADGQDKKREDEEGFYNKGNQTFSGYTLVNGVSNMYTNMEMRFYASIGFNRRFWPCSSTTQEEWKNKVVTYFWGGNADRNDAGNKSVDYNLTGYVITKFIHPEDAYKGEGALVLDKAFGIIRYAEILLSYAEAMNNLTQTHTISLPNEFGENTQYTISRNPSEIAKSFNMVRFRAGLPGLTTSELNDPAAIQKLIERERMVEFLFENRRYFDVRRWGIYETVDAQPVMGMNIFVPEAQYHVRTAINHQRTRDRVTNRRLVFIPIANSEIRKVKGLDQNPGWENY